VEFHQDKGEKWIKENPHQGIQAAVLSAGRNRPETPSSGLSRAQLSESVLLRRRRQDEAREEEAFTRQAALREQSSGEEDCRAGALLRQACLGRTRSPKGSSVCQVGAESGLSASARSCLKTVSEIHLLRQRSASLSDLPSASLRR